jgi:hypothetical protein
MVKIQGSDGRIDKCKIAIFNIDSILNWIILGLKNMEVLNFASPKWAYMFKSVEKWLCKSWKYKTVAGGAILNWSAILNFWKKITSTIFFYELMFPNPKFQMIYMNIDWIIEHSCLAVILNFFTILKCYFSKFIVLTFYGPNYQICH